MKLSPDRSRLIIAGHALLLALIGCAVYWNSLDNPFVFDDDATIVKNPHITRLWPPRWSQKYLENIDIPIEGRPLPAFTFALNYAAGELQPRGYRLVNLAIHVACALALYALLLHTLSSTVFRGRFQRSRIPLAVLAAGLWLVHPLNTECVNYLTQRTESLMALCYLLTLYCAARALEPRRPTLWSAAAVICCALGMASKEVMVTAPLTVVLYDRAFAFDNFRRAFEQRRRLYLGLCATWLLLAVLIITTPHSASAGFSFAVGPWEYLKNQAPLLLRYLRLIVWPYPLVLDYGYAEPVALARVWPAGVAVLALFAGSLWLYYKKPWAGFPLLACFILLSPTSSVVPIIAEVGAERRMYLPLMGLLALALVAGARGADSVQSPQGEKWLAGSRRLSGLPDEFLSAAVAAMIALAFVSVMRNCDYRDADSIWRTSVAAWPHSSRALVNLGIAAQHRGNYDEAEDLFRRAAALLDESDESAWFNLGHLMNLLYRSQDAVAPLQKALALNPDHPRAHNELGIALGRTGRMQDALAHFQRALELDPESFEAQNNLGYALAALGDHQRAVQYYRAALRLNPAYGPAAVNLGAALLQLGRHEEADLMLSRGVALQMEVKTLPLQVGYFYEQCGRREHALQYYQLALKRDPDSAAARSALERLK